ncbi:proteasome stabiliser-domain-containing protein [Lipomyces japonicus]|uniref:proteasome stabiliser-domain-containing protein n=1 Tax=Lipomyces japonicus TaxID=56871 RepID=UPI0034CE566B
MASAELALVDKVEMRIALANSDAKLESLLKVYLAPLLLKLGSPHDSVRKKVVSICSHINTRIKNVPISLPVESLLVQFKTPKVEGESTLVRNFCLLYIQLGIDRLTKQQQIKLLPEVINGISKYNRSFQKSLFAIILKLLPLWQGPLRGSEEEDRLRDQFGFDQNSEDAKFLSDHFTSTLLLNLVAFEEAENGRPRTCAGLTPEEFEFLTSNSKDTFTASQLFQIKVAILKFSSAVLKGYEKYWPALIGSQDGISDINNLGEDILRSFTVNYENENVVLQLYKFYLGDAIAPPVKHQLRTKILQLLSKSAIAANTSPQILQAIQQGLKSGFAKERLASIELVHWTAKIASTETLSPLADGLVKNLTDWIKNMGWPLPFSSNTQEQNLRGFAYEAIGLLGKRVPSIIEKNFNIISFLFQSLKEDRLKNSVHEALSTLIPILYQLSPENLGKLRELLLEQMKLGTDFPNNQFLALRYAISALPFSDSTARYICILGLDSSNRADIFAEAKKGLHPFWFRKIHRPDFGIKDENLVGPEYDFPDFEDLLNTVTDNWRLSAGETVEGKFGNIPDSNVIQTLKFLRQVLLMKSLAEDSSISIIDEGWTHKLDDAIIYHSEIRRNVTALLEKWHVEGQCLSRYLNLLFDSFSTQRPGLVATGELWIEFIGLSPPGLVDSWTAKINSLEALSIVHNTETRLIAARAIGIIGSALSVSDADVLSVLDKFKAYLSSGSKQITFKIHGAIVSIGFILSRLNIRGRFNIADKKFVYEIFRILSTHLDKSSDSLLREASISALYQLGAYGVLAVIDQTDILNASNSLIAYVKNKTDDRAILTFGSLTTSFEREARIKAAETIYSLHETKHIEFLFSTGEALSIIAAGWETNVLTRTIDIQGVTSDYHGDDEVLESIIEKVLEYCKVTKPSLRKSACIWLLSLLQFCGHLKPVNDKLMLIHFAFLGFLGSKDDLVQESASRGLSLVYEKGDDKLKDDLVRSLMQTFTSDSRNPQAGKISEESELFDSGEIRTQAGSSISTYKDILNLASEAGDPSLVYKFVGIASSSALWSTRKGAAFGLGSILSKTKLTDVLGINSRLTKNLVPKLYRYRYDPNPTVQQSMRDIWTSLVTDPADTINQRFDDILEELLTRMGDREWRVRQASSAALQDLLDGAPLKKYEFKIERIWTMSFRTLDDIKESVRKQAVALCRSLANSLVRNVDIAEGASQKNAKSMLQTLLPFLIGTSGLQSSAEEVQAFSLDTLLKLIQKGGTSLLPFIPGLIVELLGLLSTLEPQAVNYLALNADKYGLTSDAIDATRLAGIRNSPMTDALDRCINLLDETSMKALAPKLQSVIRKSVGLPSKVASSRVLVNLVIQHADLITPYSDRFIKTCVTQLDDRNDTVATSYATAAGYLSRVSSNETALGLISNSETMYFETDDERPRILSAAVITAISKHASDKFSALSSSILPFVYIAKHDPVTAIKEKFDQVWTENTGGVGAIKLHFAEILELANRQLLSQRWRVRQTTSLALADASNSVGNQIFQTEALFEILVKASAGRSWAGKEVVLEALATLSQKMKGYVELHVELRDRLYQLFVAEAKRNNEDYKNHAVKARDKFCTEFSLAIPLEN